MLIIIIPGFFFLVQSWHLLSPQIKVGKDFTGEEANGMNLFATTIHELAHASHWKLGYTNLTWAGSTIGRKIGESWAQAVGWYVTCEIYGIATSSPWYWNIHSQQSVYLTSMPSEIYTPLFIDLIDDFNQGTSIMTNSHLLPNENANGYTLSQLENYLAIHPTNWFSYKWHLLQNNNNDPNAAYLFDNYDDY